MMLTSFVVLKALVEIAALALLGKGLLLILVAGAKREENVFYRVLDTVTRPVWKSVRFFTPRFIVDQHIGALSFLLLGLVWLFLIFNTVELCLDDLRHPSCGKLALEYVTRCESGMTQACQVLERNGIHGQRTEDGKQGTVVGGQKTEDGRQTPPKGTTP